MEGGEGGGGAGVISILFFISFLGLGCSDFDGGYRRDAQIAQLRSFVLQTKVLSIYLIILSYRGFKPFTRTYFAVPSTNSSE
jgi:hypothetical protein